MNELQNFFKRNMHILTKEKTTFTSQKIFFQLAYEQFLAPSLRKQLEDFLNKGRVTWTWIKRTNLEKKQDSSLFNISLIEYTNILGYDVLSKSFLYSFNEDFFLLHESTLEKEKISFEQKEKILNYQDFILASEEQHILKEENTKQTILANTNIEPDANNKYLEELIYEYQSNRFRWRRNEDMRIYFSCKIGDFIFYNFFNPLEDDVPHTIYICNIKTNEETVKSIDNWDEVKITIVGKYLFIQKNVYDIDKIFIDQSLPYINEFHLVNENLIFAHDNEEYSNIYLLNLKGEILFEDSSDSSTIINSLVLYNRYALTWDHFNFNIWDLHAKNRLFEFEFITDYLDHIILGDDLIIFILRARGFDYFFNENKSEAISGKMYFHSNIFENNEFDNIHHIRKIQRISNNTILVSSYNQYSIIDLPTQSIIKTITEDEYNTLLKQNRFRDQKTKKNLETIHSFDGFYFKQDNKTIGILDDVDTNLESKVVFNYNRIYTLSNGKLRFYEIN